MVIIRYNFVPSYHTDPQPNTPTPSIFPSSTIRTTFSISRPLLGASQPTGSPNSFRPVPTVQPTPGPADNVLLITVVVVVGGVVVLLLLLIVILFILILLRRNHSADKYNVSPENK